MKEEVLYKKNKIERKELKSNFLKKSILRLDYDYLFEENMEEIIKNLNPYLNNEGFRMKAKTMAELSTNINGDKLIQEEQIIFNKTKQEKFPSYISEDQNVILDISRNFTTITVNYKENKPFEEIMEIFNRIISEIRKVREGLNLNRIGIRKINLYLLKNIENINNYFEESIFSFNSQDLKKVLLKQQLEVFNYNSYKVNLRSEINQGVITENENKESIAYRVSLDIDVYDDVLEKNQIDLKTMNQDLFEIYKSNLKVEFLEDLKKENYKNEELIKL